MGNYVQYKGGNFHVEFPGKLMAAIDRFLHSLQMAVTLPSYLL